MEVKGLALLWTYNNNKSHGSVHGGGMALHLHMGCEVTLALE
jgi:hypothetical protein